MSNKFKTIVSRKNYLSEILRKHPIGFCLEEEELEIVKNFYQSYYKPPQQTFKKYTNSEIVSIKIGANVYCPGLAPSKCFLFTCNEKQKTICISKKFLDGSKISMV